MGALGVKVEMRLKPGKPASQGAFYLTPAAQRRGEVAAVLGAGNQVGGWWAGPPCEAGWAAVPAAKCGLLLLLLLPQPWALPAAAGELCPRRWLQAALGGLALLLVAGLCPFTCCTASRPIASSQDPDPIHCCSTSRRCLFCCGAVSLLLPAPPHPARPHPPHPSTPPWPPQHFLALCDALHLAFVDGAAVLLKYHPLQASIQPFIDYLLEPLAQRGVFTGVTCGVPTTQHLVQSPLVDRVHLTGGNATHDAIVWGPDPTQQARHKAAGQPVLTKPITSELVRRPRARALDWGGAPRLAAVDMHCRS